MEKLSLESFQEFKVAESSKVIGGECTGGGFVNFGGGAYCSWESDETNGGSTTYYDVHCEF
jgi:hypothetical protein